MGRSLSSYQGFSVLTLPFFLLQGPAVTLWAPCRSALTAITAVTRCTGRSTCRRRAATAVSSALTRSVPTPALSARNPSVPTPRYGEDSQKTHLMGKALGNIGFIYIFFFSFSSVYCFMFMAIITYT